MTMDDINLLELLDLVRPASLETVMASDDDNPPTMSQNGGIDISGPIPISIGHNPIVASSVSVPTTQNTVLLEQEVILLRGELARSREHIRKLQEQEKQLRERLAGYVHSQFVNKPSQVFENLNLGDQRPTSLVRAYDDLYREARVDTLDALDALPELAGLDILKMKILFSVVVLSFRCVQQTLHELKGKLRHLLCLPLSSEMEMNGRDPATTDMEDQISKYLTLTTDRFDVNNIVNDVCQNIYATLYDYPGLKSCNRLTEYTKTTVRLAWGLSVQNPPYCISYDSKLFQAQTLERFHTSDSESEHVKSFLWPMLLDGCSGMCVAKGVVIT